MQRNRSQAETEQEEVDTLNSETHIPQIEDNQQVLNKSKRKGSAGFNQRKMQKQTNLSLPQFQLQNQSKNQRK